MLIQRSNIGDVYSIPIGYTKNKYFQHIANDSTHLKSSVIRVFYHHHPSTAKISIEDIVNDKVDFYAHVVIKTGILEKYWKRIGRSAYIGNTDILFRAYNVNGLPEDKVEYRWKIWKLNHPCKFVNELDDDYKNAEIGIIFAPSKIFDRIKKGKYSFDYTTL